MQHVTLVGVLFPGDDEQSTEKPQSKIDAVVQRHLTQDGKQ